MNRTSVIARALLCLSFVLMGLLASIPADGPVALAQTREPSTVEGVVLDDQTKQPLEGVTVTLVGGAGSSTLVRTTNAAGHFQFSGVSRGRHELTPKKSGYSLWLPERTSGSRWVSISEQDQNVRNLEVRMVRTGVVSGRVLLPDGRPVLRVFVSLSRSIYDEDGKPHLEAVSGKFSSPTNDLGEYRLYDAEPGEYQILATFRKPVEFDSRLFLDTYYPGTGDIDRAESVRVRPGEELRLNDMTLIEAQTVSVRLHFDETEGPLARMIQVGDSNIVFNTQREKAGQILIPSVPSGPLEALFMWRSTTGVTTYSRVRIDVGGVAVDQAITAQPMHRLNIRILTEDSSGRRRESVNVGCRLRSDVQLWPDQCSGKAGDLYILAPSGSFDLQLTGTTEDTYVVEMRASDGTLVPDRVHVDRDATLQVVLSESGGIIDGTVLNAEGQPTSDAVVALVPDEPLREASHLYRTSVSSVNGGSFELRGIAPGNYRLFAWMNIRGAAYKNAAFMKPFENQGQPIKIEQGMRVSMNVVIAQEKRD
jgi:hypothetical protein